MVVFSIFLNIFRLSSKFPLLLLIAGVSWGDIVVNFEDFGGRGVFLLGYFVDFFRPKCFKSRVSCLIFIKICRPKWGWGFFFIFFGGFLIFLG